MGAKKWQIDDLREQIKFLDMKIKLLLDCVDFYEQYFARSDGGKMAKQTKAKLRTLEGIEK